MGGGSDANFSDSEIYDYEEKPYEMLANFSTETRKLRRIVSKHIKACEQGIELENKKQRLDSWSEELNKREALIESEKQKLQEMKIKNDLRNNALQLAYEEQREANENVLKLAEAQTREKEAALKKVLELERSSEYEKQKLELEIKVLKAKLEVMKHVGDDDDDDEAAIRRKIDRMPKIRQEAFKKLISGLCNLLSISSVNIIGNKRMNEIDAKAFTYACSLRFPLGRPQIKADDLCSLWQEMLKNPEWNPFKIIEDQNGNAQWFLNKDDELLRGLEYKWGYEVYDAVTTALKVLIKYNDNPNGCYVVPELWDFVTKKKATLREVITYIIVQLRAFKRGKT